MIQNKVSFPNTGIPPRLETMNSNHSFPTLWPCNWYQSQSVRNYMAVWCRFTLPILHTSFTVASAFSSTRVNVLPMSHRLQHSGILDIPSRYVASLFFNSDTVDILVQRDSWFTKQNIFKAIGNFAFLTT